MEKERNKINIRPWAVIAVSVLFLCLCTWLIYSYSQQLLKEEKALYEARNKEFQENFQRAQDRENITELIQAIPGSSENPDSFSVTLRNKTHYFLDQVNVTVSFVNEKGKTFKTEKLEFSNIPARSDTVRQLHTNQKGKNIKCRITVVKSKELGL